MEEKKNKAFQKLIRTSENSKILLTCTELMLPSTFAVYSDKLFSHIMAFKLKCNCIGP